MMENQKFWIFIVAVVVLMGASCSRAPDRAPVAQPNRTYVTRRTLEPDKLASIWLIKRHLNKEAQFIFVEDDVPLPKGIPFDTPEAEFRRYANLSCFESILKKYNINDPALCYFGNLIHDIEVNYWGEKHFRESSQLNAQLVEMIKANSENPQNCLTNALVFFDHFMGEIRNKQVK